MWCIILYYIVVIVRQVSTNVFPFRSAMVTSNVYRTNMMHPVRFGQPSPPPVQLQSRHKPVCGPVPFPGCEPPTTCVENLSPLHRNHQRVCYTIRRWPNTVQHMMVSVPQVQRYSPMMPPVLRQMPPQATMPQAMITNRMVVLQPRSPQQLRPQMIVSQNFQPPQNMYKQFNNYKMENVFQQNMTLSPRLGMQRSRIPATPEVTLQSYFYPRVENDYPILMPLKKMRKQTRQWSTMPPFPGGVMPDSDDNDEPFLLCAGGKAKCNKYLWTTKKKNHSKKTTKALLLWTI
ncbi:hypothetical protein HF086_005349 [Spodoptera exigua]|uniref:Uncharacterized protein n=1 Tax=Spodoptera exigua TaxID=7107 RepID=A0A922SLQ7_SPOEX|nr:hypothetical protein HF086_005349 [Spodoptera exigua]